MPSAATPAQPPSQHQQHRYKDGQPQHRSSSSRTVNPATGMPDRVGNYSIREEIGRGSFATVYRGEKVTTNPATLVAIKAVVRSKLTTKLLENLESEIRLLKGIKQRNVVELVDCLKTEAHIYLVMAYCSAGDLSQYIRKRGQIPSLTSSMQQAYREKYPHPKDGGLNELVVRCFLGQLAEALKFLRNQNIIHRDIKPQNLLLHPPDPSDIEAGHPQGIPLLRVADFGFARALPNTSLAETLCGSPLYMAPEILRYEKYDAKADLWSVGAVTYEMTIGKPPFRAQNHVELLRRIERGEDRIKFPDDKSPSASAEPGKEEAPPTKVADDLKAIIRGLLKRNPVERMSFVDFFKEADNIARWGEGSLVAPGTIKEVHSPALSRQPSGQDQLSRPRGPSRPASSRASPVPVDRSAPVSPPAPSPIIKDLSAATETPIIPTSGEEQEMAFVPLPLMAQLPLQSSGAASANDTPTAVQAQVEPSPARPSAPSRRSTFKPKYIVGTEAAQKGGSSAVLKTRDYAVITTTAPTPTTQAPRSVNPNHMGGSSQANPPRDRNSPIDNTPQPTPRSNLTLALPVAGERLATQQRDMLASAMTGDDDSILGREYVVVDKRNVEYNALADEMASDPRRPHALSHRSSRGILSRQTTGYGQSSATPPTYGNLVADHGNSPSPPSPALPYPPTAQTAAYEHPPFALPAGTRLSPAPYGTSPRNRATPVTATGQSSPVRYGSNAATAHTGEQLYTSPLGIVGGITLPSNAISKALNMASLKLFGSPSENIWLRKQSHRLPFARRRSQQPAAQENGPSAEEEELMQKLEDVAQKATVIFDFADSKLIMMQPQSSQQSLSSNQRSPLLTDAGNQSSGQAVLGGSQANPFFVSASRSGTSPALANRRTSSSSDHRPSSPLVKGSQASPTLVQSPAVPPSSASSKPDLLPGETLVLYLKALAFLSKGIEMARDFWAARNPGQPASADLNEYVQWLRARFNECFDKAEYAKGRLVGDIPDSAMLAEKLIFDRALEMSRAAAVSELMGENAQECEIAYDTALWMLYAILDETMQEGELVDEEDTITVRNFIESIKGRLGALRRKMRTSSTL